MSRLRIFTESKPSQFLLETYRHAEIAEHLKNISVRFEQWQTDSSIKPGDAAEKVIAAYQTDIERLKSECGYQAVDVVSLHPNHPEREVFRQKFLNEHTHSEDEVRFFVAGRGLFTLHVENKVFEILCEQGDLIGVPDNTKHWFDMGPEPNFVAIRLFTNPAGWVANFTGTDLAKQFARLETPFIEAIVTDIEGTTSDIDFVKNVLFPFSRERLDSFVRAHAHHVQVREALVQTAAEIGAQSDDLDTCIAALIRWIDEDRKITPLKTIQGLIWQHGYAAKNFSAHVYADAPIKLRQWKNNGKRLFVYSSGSVAAQKMFFANSKVGDITDLFEDYFDTRIGGKREVDSYRKIAQVIAIEPSRILFLSDIEAELDAARQAGWLTGWLRRKDFKSNETSPHQIAPSFTELDVH